MKTRVIEFVGWYGAVAILAAYAMLSFGVLKPGIVYQLLNVTGAFGVALVSFQKRAHAPGVLNFIWMLIAVVSIFKI